MTGFGPGPVRVVVTVGSGTLSLSAASTDVSVPFGYPDLGVEGAQVAVGRGRRGREQRPRRVAVDAGDAGTDGPDAGSRPGRTDVCADRLGGLRALGHRGGGPANWFQRRAQEQASATVSWRPPISDGGSAIIGYVVAGSPAGWCSVSAATRSCVVTDLTAGTNYRFRVAAINGAELGALVDALATR